MTIANSVAAKLFVAFVAIAMAFSFAAPASAQMSESEMQDEIERLTALIEQLTASIGGTTSVELTGSTVCPYTWTRSLTTGSTGGDVMKLQQFLNSSEDTRVAMTGAGSVGAETQYYGPATAAAVSKFQVKYRTDILAPSGLVNPTGYFGPSSMAKANALCSTAAPTTPDDDEDEDEDDEDVELSGEASLDTVEVDEGDDTNIEEGQEAAPVADITVEFTDGDAEISRIDIALVGTGDEQDPWDTFEEVSLWVDGDEVASMAADDEDEYLDEDDGSLRFSDLDIVAMEDEEVVITVAVTVQGSVDGTNNGEAWTLGVDAIRYVDADDVTTTDDATGDMPSAVTADFDIEEEGGEDELIVKASSEDPDATTLQVEETDQSDFMTIFAFDLDSDDSTNDIELHELTVAVVTPNDVVNQVVSDIQLLIDGETFDDVTWTNNTTATATAAFDIDGDFTIDAGERVTVEVQVEFKQLTGNFDEGDTIFASTTSATIDAEGADDLTVAANQLDGTAEGDVHTLRSAGLVVETTDTNETIKDNTDTTEADDEGVFTIEFDVTAFESDVYIDNNGLRGLVETNTGVNFIMTSGGNTVTTGTTTSSLSSAADLENGRYLVSEGETESFTLTVEFDPLTSGFHKLELYSVNFNDTNADADVQQLVTPASNFDTDEISI